MTTRSRRLTVQRWLARLQTRYQSSTDIAAPGLWFELGSDFQTSLLKFKINMEHTPPPLQKREKERGMQSGRKCGGYDSLHPYGPRDLGFIRDNYLICFISTLPQGLAGRTSGLFAVCRETAASQGPVDRVIKTLQAPAARDKMFFFAFVKIFLFQPPRDAEETAFYLSGCPSGTEVASESANKLLTLLSGEVRVACVCFHGPGPRCTQRRLLCSKQHWHLLKVE